MENQYLLKMEHVYKSFPGVNALKDVSFDLRNGEIHALVGENGAGKSTLMKILAGVFPADQGKIFVSGQEVKMTNLLEAQSLGIGIIFQEFNLIPHLSVAENIFFGRLPLKIPMRQIDWKKLWEDTEKLLSSLEVNIQPKTRVKSLSVAYMQMVEIAKALSLNSRILVMDEPTSALSKNEIDILFSRMKYLKNQGVGIIFISHRLDEIKQIADRITVLRDGNRIQTVDAKDVNEEEIARMMVGRELKAMFPKSETTIGEEVLRVEHLSRKNTLYDISLVLHAGEILGIYGLVGAGRTELVRAIFGADARDSGTVYVSGKPVDLKDPNDAVRSGIGLVPEDRTQHGLLLAMSVKHNITLTNLSKYYRRGKIDVNLENKNSRHHVVTLGVKTPSLEQKVLNLSGGNQQKIVLAKWLERNPRVLILDEPTRGIDVGAKAEIHFLMGKLVKEGIGIIMISSELPEVMGMSDRILVMNQGRITAEFSRTEATPQKIILAATGGRIYERV